MGIQQASSSSSSSSSSSPCPPTVKNCKYEVFLSFRGVDTRKNFTDHFYSALKHKGINAFRDDNNLQRGKTISKALVRAIKDSRISVIIFSMNYASSTWCLDELAQAYECMKVGTQIVLPVFYGVDPNEVRKQTGRYGAAIAEHEIAIASVECGTKVDKWKTALTEVANLSGWDLKDRHEAEAIQEIVEDIFTKLCRTSSGATTHLVGIDSRLDELTARLCVGLDDVRMVGIWGMAGIGKTTLAKVVFDKLSSHFDASCFISDVREADERHDLVSLQEQLLDDIIGFKNIKLRSVHQGIDLVSQRLRWRKVLVVLDDVNKWEQLESLAGSPDWFGPGSRVIFTTRDEHLSLKYGLENKPYRIEGLNHKESFKLFCTKAFDNEYPANGFLKLSNEIVTYCGGLPLALQVLGSFFRGRSVTEWQSGLAGLKEIPNSEIMEKLQISFNGLKETEKEIFLHIACFFKGKKKNYITKILESCGFYLDIGLSVLKEKSLITIESNDCVSMHDLLQEMGREIVRRESPREPGNRSRLWRYRDAYRVLENDTGTDKVEGIVLDSHRTTEVCTSAKAFGRMTKVKLLILWNLHFLEGLEFLSNELRYLEWSGYRFKSLPSSFHPDELVELHLSHSNIKQLWKRKQCVLQTLKVINLSYSQNLIKTPNFYEVPNLEELILEGCTRLRGVHQSIGVLRRLELLNLKDCKSLKELPSTICDLKSLKNLILHGCPELHKLPERLGDLTCLEVLDLGRAVASEQPPTRPWGFLLRPWQLLPWKDPRPVALTLPPLSTLLSLKDLNLSYCKLKEGAIPNDLGCLPSLESFNLSGNDFKSLPTSIGQLSKVKRILLADCKRLQSLPNLPSTVQCLYCRGCKSLVTIPGSICGLSNLHTLELDNCRSVKSLPNLPTNIRQLSMDGCASLETLPHNISGLSRLSSLHLDNCESLRTLPDLSESLNSTDIYLSFLNCLKLTEKQGVFGWVKKCLHSILKNKSQGLPKLIVWISYTGGGIPGWFNYVSEGDSLKAELPPYWFNIGCLGFSFCVVFGVEDSAAKDYRFFVSTVKAWIKTENPVSFILYYDGWYLPVSTCFNSDVALSIFIPCAKSRSADWWKSLSHLEVSITDDDDVDDDGLPNPKAKYMGLRIVYEQDVDELSRWSGTSSSLPFHNVVSTNKPSHDDDCCSSDSQVETRPSSERLKLEGD